MDTGVLEKNAGTFVINGCALSRTLTCVLKAYGVIFSNLFLVVKRFWRRC